MYAKSLNWNLIEKKLNQEWINEEKKDCYKKLFDILTINSSIEGCASSSSKGSLYSLGTMPGAWHLDANSHNTNPQAYMSMRKKESRFNSIEFSNTSGAMYLLVPTWKVRSSSLGVGKYAKKNLVHIRPFYAWNAFYILVHIWQKIWGGFVKLELKYPKHKQYPILKEISEKRNWILVRTIDLNMPKVPNPHSLIKEFGGNDVWTYNSSSKSLFCKLCSKTFTVARRFIIAQHVGTIAHKRKLDIQRQGKPPDLQQTLHQVVPEPESSFAKDLCKMIVACELAFVLEKKPDLLKLRQYAKGHQRWIHGSTRNESKYAYSLLMCTSNFNWLWKDLFQAEFSSDCSKNKAHRDP